MLLLSAVMAKAHADNGLISVSFQKIHLEGIHCLNAAGLEEFLPVKDSRSLAGDSTTGA